MSQDFKDYYNILGIPFSASEAEIKTAYRKLARELHPDMHADETEHYTQKFQQVTEAYETLSDVMKKGNYDFRYRQLVLHEGPVFEDVVDDTPPDTKIYKHKYTYRNKRTFSYASIGGLILLSLHFLRLLINAAPIYDNTHYAKGYGPLPQGTSVRAPAFEQKEPHSNADSLTVPYSSAPFMDKAGH